MTAPPPPATPPTTAARPVAGLSKALTALMVASGLLSLPLYVSSWTDLSRVSAHVERGMDDDVFWQQEYGKFDFLFAALYIVVPALLASTVVLLVWSYRARTNAALISPNHPFRHSPAFSAGGLMIPFANLWFVRPILEDIWIGSRPAGAIDDGARPVRNFWLWCVAGAVVSIVGDLAVPTSVITYDPSGRIVSGGGEAAGAALGAALFNTVLLAGAVVTTVKLIMVVRQVTRWQTEQLSV